MKLVEILKETLNEINDVVPIEQLKDIGIDYDITSEYEDTFFVKINYAKFEEPFGLLIRGDQHNAIFGPIVGNKIDVGTNFNVPEMKVIRKAIFSFLKYYVDKFNIEYFEFTCDDSMRKDLYTNFMEKWFSDYNMTIRSIGARFAFEMKKKSNDDKGKTV